jgi:protein gp37
MGDHSAIAWTDATWNPLAGCSRVSEGCRHCYAEHEAHRLGTALRQVKYAGLTKLVGQEPRWTGDVRLWPAALDQPLRWRQPRRIFVNSMSDLFHEAVALDDIRRIFAVMAQAPWHVFQILTKRAERLAAIAGELPWPPNVWQGVSVETADYTSRITRLQTVPARVRFLSLEPLLGPMPHLPLVGIHWVIAGGESGPGFRPPDLAWARSLRDQCLAASVPFFFKQWGGRTAKSGGRLLDGRMWDEMPPKASEAEVDA